MKSLTKLIATVALLTSLTACVGPHHGGERDHRRGGGSQPTNTILGAAVGGVAGYALGDSVGATLGGAALGGVIGSQVK